MIFRILLSAVFLGWLIPLEADAYFDSGFQNLIFSYLGHVTFLIFAVLIACYRWVGSISLSIFLRLKRIFLRRKQ